MLLANERALSKSTGAVTGGGPYQGLVWGADGTNARRIDPSVKQANFGKKSEGYRPGISHRSLPRGRTRGAVADSERTGHREAKDVFSYAKRCKKVL
jgi:hypothetical protein